MSNQMSARQLHRQAGGARSRAWLWWRPLLPDFASDARADGGVFVAGVWAVKILGTHRFQRAASMADGVSPVGKRLSQRLHATGYASFPTCRLRGCRLPTGI